MISVCMATYNGSKTIEKQLQSILKQLDANDEVIIVDDCSKDNTLEKIKELSNNYPVDIKILQNQVNSGPIASFEKALGAAHGDYVFLSDQDDEWFSDKVATVMTTFQEKQCDLVLHDGVVVDQNSQVLDPSWNHYNHNEVHQGVFGSLKKNAYTGAMMALSKDLVNQALPFPKQIEMHDQWLFFVAKKKHLKIAILEMPLMNYVRHGNNVTGMKKRSLSSQLYGRIKMFLALLLNTS